MQNPYRSTQPTHSTHPLNPSTQPIHQTHPLTPSARSIHSTHPLNPSTQTYLLNPSTQSIHSTHPLNLPTQPHPLNPSSQPIHSTIQPSNQPRYPAQHGFHPPPPPRSPLAAGRCTHSDSLAIHLSLVAASLKVAATLQVGHPMTKERSRGRVSSVTSSTHVDSHTSHSGTRNFSLNVVEFLHKERHSGLFGFSHTGMSVQRTLLVNIKSQET